MTKKGYKQTKEHRRKTSLINGGVRLSYEIKIF